MGRQIGIIGLILCICAMAVGQQAASTKTSTQPSTRSSRLLSNSQPTTSPTTRAADPLETPESAVLYLLVLIKNVQVVDIRAMMADKEADQQLVAAVKEVAQQMRAGAQCELLESRIEGLAAAVFYKTTYVDKREDISTVMLVRQYDRWKPLLGKMNPRRFSEAERNDLKTITDWADGRRKELTTLTEAAKTKVP